MALRLLLLVTALIATLGLTGVMCDDGAKTTQTTSTGSTASTAMSTMSPATPTKSTPLTPAADWGKDKWATCNSTQEEKMEEEMENVEKCFGEVLSGAKDSSCKTIENIKSHTDKFINESSCLYKYEDDKEKKTAKDKLEKHVGVIFNMMNETIKNYQDVAPIAKRCINKILLLGCVSQTLPQQKYLVDRLKNNFPVIDLVRTLDFNNTAARRNGKEINECVAKIFKSETDCGIMANLTATLYQIANATVYSNSSTIVAINSVVLIATTLLALLFK